MQSPRTERIAFDRWDIENVLAEMPPDEMDALPFGVIRLDANGKILYYSAREGELASRRHDDVIGKNFFDEVAPCTKRPEFHGRFVNGVKQGRFAVTFQYTFDYRMNPLSVRVHMKRGEGEHASAVWVMVERVEADWA
ncbi:MAG: PAS domain-containing protein [Gemmatimonadota bacterium]|nr:PAS domain-containing protein [Gemmatimonadota bacterium]